MPLTPGSVLMQFRIILEQIRYKKIHFHDLRHTFITMPPENGIDTKTFSAMLGHASAATTLNIDTYITADTLGETAAKIDQGLSN